MNLTKFIVLVGVISLFVAVVASAPVDDDDDDADDDVEEQGSYWGSWSGYAQSSLSGIGSYAKSWLKPLMERVWSMTKDAEAKIRTMVSNAIMNGFERMRNGINRSVFGGPEDDDDDGENNRDTSDNNKGSDSNGKTDSKHGSAHMKPMHSTESEAERRKEEKESAWFG